MPLNQTKFKPFQKFLIKPKGTTISDMQQSIPVEVGSMYKVSNLDILEASKIMRLITKGGFEFSQLIKGDNMMITITKPATYFKGY